HEHALRRAGVRLASTEGDSVYESVVAAVREVVPDKEAQIRLLVCNEEAPTLAASSEPLPATRALDADAAGWLHSTLVHTAPLPATAVPVSVQDVLGLGDDSYAHFSRLATRSETSGALVIATERPLPADELALLDSLATHVSLSLESAALSAEAHRQKSEARFRSLVGNSTDLITVLDADGVVTYQSPSIESVLGYAPEETDGRRL